MVKKLAYGHRIQLASWNLSYLIDKLTELIDVDDYKD